MSARRRATGALLVAAFAALICAAACGRSSTAAAPTARTSAQQPARSADAPAGATPPVATTSELQLSMRSHFDEVRAIELALLFGRLEDARTHARSLAVMASEARLRERSLARVRATAAELAAVDSVDSAFPLAARLASQCATCHLASRAIVRLRPVAEPEEDGTIEGRMERHQWAADRLWEGLVTPSDEQWRDGLEVLVGAPLPPTAITDDRSQEAVVIALGEELIGQAREAMGASQPPERSHLFARMLKVCASCHALVGR